MVLYDLSLSKGFSGKNIWQPCLSFNVDNMRQSGFSQRSRVLSRNTYTHIRADLLGLQLTDCRCGDFSVSITMSLLIIINAFLKENNSMFTVNSMAMYFFSESTLFFMRTLAVVCSLRPHAGVAATLVLSVNAQGIVFCFSE